MRPFAFYIFVALLTFGIGSSMASNFYWKTDIKIQKLYEIEASQKHLTNPTANNLLEKNVDNPKYSCKEKQLESFWEKLDKEAFLKFKRQEIKIQNTSSEFTSYPDMNSFEKEWRYFQKSFDCSYFLGINEEIDLNSDGEKEIFVTGEFGMRDGETFVFQRKDDKLKPILHDVCNIEREIKQTKSKGFSDITFSENWSGGSRMISHYQFNGKTYEAKKCFSEAYMIEKNGEMIQVDKPVVIRTPCNKLSNILK